MSQQPSACPYSDDTLQTGDILLSTRAPRVCHLDDGRVPLRHRHRYPARKWYEPLVTAWSSVARYASSVTAQYSTPKSPHASATVSTTQEPVHIAMVLRDPTFVDPCLRGLYVWCIVAPESCEITSFADLRVHILPLADYLNSCAGRTGDGTVWVRQCVHPIPCKGVINGVMSTGQLDPATLKSIHCEVSGRDETNNHRAANKTSANDSHTSAWTKMVQRIFAMSSRTLPSAHWSSAFVGFLCVRLGVLDNRRTAWYNLTPNHFAQETECLWYANGALDLGSLSSSFIGGSVDKSPSCDALYRGRDADVDPDCVEIHLSDEEGDLPVAQKTYAPSTWRRDRAILSTRGGMFFGKTHRLV